MDYILSDQKKFTTVNLKDDTLLNFAINKEKHINKVLKKLVKPSRMTEKKQEIVKSCRQQTRCYDSYKVQKASVENCPQFRPILSVWNTPTYELAKLLVLIVKHLTTYKFTVKDSFHFTEEIVDQPDFFMSSLDVDSTFTNISLCTNELFKESETFGGLSKFEFKEVLSLATKYSHFIFYEIHFRHFFIFFLVYHEKKKKKKPGYNVVYSNIDHLFYYQPFTIENEKDNRMFFPDVNIIR